jgi:SM-20-related protein
MQHGNSMLDARSVDVQIHLAGGHRHDLVLASDSPLLRDLFLALAAKDEPDRASQPVFFQLPLGGGRSACSFSSAQLVSVVTYPPVVIEPVRRQPQPSLAPDWVIPSVYAQYDDFLTPDECRQLLAYTLDNEDKFEVSTTSTNEKDYRSSRVLYAISESPWRKTFADRLRVYLPQVLHEFNVASFPIGQIEIQLTAHNDGQYYKVHNDSGSQDTEPRQVSYVYYFNKEPKGFSGGELKLYDGRVENGYIVGAAPYRIVEPRNNSIAIFLSGAHHEVLPVRCPSGAFADGRFTVNGWIRQTTEASAAD